MLKCKFKNKVNTNSGEQKVFFIQKGSFVAKGIIYCWV